MGFISSIRSALSRTLSPLAPLGSASGSGGWSSIVCAALHGAWQLNQSQTVASVLAHPAVLSCTNLIASDIGKVRLGLVRETDGIWTDTYSAAFSPVLYKPNRYQSFGKFVEQWVVSCLSHGNTYVLKQRDNRGLVVAMYVLDPTRVTPLVAPDGDVYYQLSRDDLAGLSDAELARVPAVPARDIIHDLEVALFHPLVGVAPIFAAGLAALQGLTIQRRRRNFQSGSNPAGSCRPGKIPTTCMRSRTIGRELQATSARSLLGDNLQYKALSNPVDSHSSAPEWSTETICSCYHVPASPIDN